MVRKNNTFHLYKLDTSHTFSFSHPARIEIEESKHDWHEYYLQLPSREKIDIFLYILYSSYWQTSRKAILIPLRAGNANFAILKIFVISHKGSKIEQYGAR